jgi:hypothetical protein
MRPFRPATDKWPQNQALVALLFPYTHVLSIPLNRLADRTRAKRRSASPSSRRRARWPLCSAAWKARLP